jgi:hypothetical protein
MKPKVFCIGFHKTGTTTLEVALKKLGYRVTGSFGTKDPGIAGKVHEMAYEMVEEFDAFEDNPWPILYKELDARFVGSKFILTRRPAEAWIRSQVKDFASTEKYSSTSRIVRTICWLSTCPPMPAGTNSVRSWAVTFPMSRSRTRTRRACRAN